MSTSELEMLSRAHRLFTGAGRLANPDTADAPYGGLSDSLAALNSGEGHDRYRLAVQASRDVLRSAGRTDAAIAAVIAGAHQDHAGAGEQTKSVLDEARPMR